MSRDFILHRPAQSHCAEYLVYFIPGNPGLVAYYATFLKRLHAELTARYPDSRIAVVGRSLAGFELDPFASSGRLYGLDEQVAHVKQGLRDALASACGPIGTSEATERKEPVAVTLVGHSLGGYLMLRVIQDALKQDASPTSTSQEPIPFSITAGIPLFPAVVDIHKSRNAQNFGWVAGVPFAGPILGLAGGAFISVLHFSLGDAVLRQVVARVMGHAGADPESEQAHGVQVTSAWLLSPTGLKQTIKLGGEEMRFIHEDTWDDTIWGSQQSATFTHGGSNLEKGQKPPKLFFYFGAVDGWMADRTRDDLIAARAYVPSVSGEDAKGRWERDSRPYMEVDQMGTPHSFCIGHSEKIADKVVELVAQVL